MIDQKLVFATPPKQRIVSLDFLRGIAILGILIMNIQSFAMIEAAYLNPSAYGDLNGLNRWVWILSHMFADQKFMTIFAIMFGAGIVLLSSRLEAKGLNPSRIHYRRTLWLIVIGMIHAYFLWHGDILVVYGLCALVVYQLRNLSIKKLILVGIILLCISPILYSIFGWSLPYWPPASVEGIMSSWKPNPDLIAREISRMQGNWFEQLPHRIPSALSFQTFVFLIWAGWRVSGLMLIGMALYKWGILSALRSKKFYLLAMLINLCLGLPMIIMGILKNFDANWSLEYSMFFGPQFNYWGSICIAFAYIGFFMLLYNLLQNSKFIRGIANVGRTALSNYILQTVICTIIFYGHGFGLFGQVERSKQIIIVLAVWICQIALTQIWVRFFMFGPVEWLWRSLTYFKRQPLVVDKN